MGLDIRLTIGLLFLTLSLLLIGFGCFGSQEIYERSLGLNVNVIWGAVLLAFAIVMLVMSYFGARSGGAARASEGKQS